jgi:photosystem II stability/assembly factor-like uncharacterized protein
MQFINSNTGWATVKQSTYLYTLIRTTNSGLNWAAIYSDYGKVQNIQFINDTLGYAMGYAYGNMLLKTTNSGYNWTVMQYSSSYVYSGFYFVNADTGWVSAFHIPSQVTLRTTNGFLTLEQISTGGGGTPATVYFFKEKINGEYFGYILGAGILSKTTNSGYNWLQINFTEAGSVNSFSFINIDTGWVVFYPNVGNAKILYTLNQGQNWILQNISNYNIDFGIIYAVNYNKIWTGKRNYFVNISIDGGINWGSQDCQIINPFGILMIDTNIGFAWNNYNSNNLVRTNNGGGPIMSVERISDVIPTNFKLQQNYPNPFNNTTNIKYQIPKNSYVVLKIYDVLGREINTLVREIQSAGFYQSKWDASGHSSGIYFYKLTTFEKGTGKVFQMTKKMIYSK